MKKMNELLQEAKEELNKNDLLAVLLDDVTDSAKRLSFEPWLDAITGMEITRTNTKDKVLVAPEKFNILWIIPVQRVVEQNELDTAMLDEKFLKAIRPDIEKLLRGITFIARETLDKQDELILKGLYKCEDIIQYDIVTSRKKEIQIQVLLQIRATHVIPKDVSKTPYWNTEA